MNEKTATNPKGAGRKKKKYKRTQLGVYLPSDKIEEVRRFIKRLEVGICECSSSGFYVESYKDVTKYYCDKCHAVIK